MARSRKNSLPGPNDGDGIQFATATCETSETQLKLSDFPVGARVLVRSRTDWRTAAIARIVKDTSTIVLTVCSPSGHSYRLRRDPTTEIVVEGGFAILPADADDTWRDNFSKYDFRW